MIPADDTEIQSFETFAANGLRLLKHLEMQAIIAAISLDEIAQVQKKRRICGSAACGRSQQPRHAILPHLRIAAKLTLAHAPFPFHFGTIAGVI